MLCKLRVYDCLLYTLQLLSTHAMDRSIPNNIVGIVLLHEIVSYAEPLNMRKTGIQEVKKYPIPPHNTLISTGIPHSDAAVVTAPNVL